MTPTSLDVDLAGKTFWDGFWQHQYGRRFAGVSYFQRCMTELLRKHAPPGSDACEIGCGGSTWMPMLAADGVHVSGIDYSEKGLELARRNLERAGVTASLIRADVRDPNALPRDAFDLVFSSGFIEHFEGPSSILSAIVPAIRRGGAMITLVPNFAGPWGRLQKLVDPELFAVHKVYTPATLDAIHEAAGLKVLRRAAYFGGFGPLVVNYTRILRPMPPPLRTAAVAALWAGQQATAWTLATVGLRNSSWYSLHLAGIYQRP